MRSVVAILAIAFPAVVVAQAVHLKGGATVNIEPMHGYENHLAAAFAKRHVPLIVVAEKDKAEYIVTSTVAEAQNAEMRTREETSTSIAIVDPRTSRIVFAYASGKPDLPQETAEDCAKHIREDH